MTLQEACNLICHGSILESSMATVLHELDNTNGYIGYKGYITKYLDTDLGTTKIGEIDDFEEQLFQYKMRKL